MSETEHTHQTDETVKTSKTGLFVGIIIILLVIIVGLGLYAYHLAQRPLQATPAQPNTVHSQQVIHRAPHQQTRLQHNLPLPKPASKMHNANTQPTQPHPASQAQRQTQAQPTIQQDPFAAMQQQMQQMQREMDHMAADAFQNQQHFFANMHTPNTMGHFMQASGFQLNDNGNHYTVTVNAPGMDKNEINVKLSGQQLTISGKVDQKTKKPHQQAQYMREFSQMMTLPEPVDGQGMQTHYKKGVLTITIPKRTPTQNKRVH